MSPFYFFCLGNNSVRIRGYDKLKQGEVRNMELVKTSDLKKYYRTGEICVKALDQVNLSVEEGEFIAVVGPSGCGKTTLLNMLGGLDNPTEGTVLIHGKDITKMKSEELTVYRRKHIGFVFQNYNLLQTLNVKSNILLPLYLGNSKIDEAYFEEMCYERGTLAGNITESTGYAI